MTMLYKLEHRQMHQDIFNSTHQMTLPCLVSMQSTIQLAYFFIKELVITKLINAATISPLLISRAIFELEVFRGLHCQILNKTFLNT